MRDARARFAEVVRKAGTEGPQTVTYRGVDAVVVLSIEEYQRLQPQEKSLFEYLCSGPKLADDIVDMINERPYDTGRDVELP